MSDELQAAMERVKASTERAIKAELRRLTREASKSPSDVRALLDGWRADRETLTFSDPQPPVGTLVRDDCGREWENSGVYPCAWEPAGGGDPETWVKVAGNYGPVTVIEWGEGDRCSECGKLMKPGYRYSNCCFAATVDGGGEGE